MGKKNSKRAKAKQAEAPSSSSLTINDLPNEVLPTILNSLSGLNILDCMHLNEGFYHASLDIFRSTTVSENALEAACEQENFNAVKAMLQNQETKRNIQTASHWKQRTVFEAAAKTGNLRICQFLLMEAVGRLHVHQATVQAAFYEAAKHCHEDVSLYFLQEGARFSDDIKDLFCSSAAKNNLKGVEFLLGLQYGTYKLNVDDSRYGSSALHGAVENGHLEMVQYLLDHGADVNNKGYGNRPPIVYAKTEDITRLLLSKNPDLSGVSSRTLYTVLHYAAMNNNVVLAEEALKALKDQGKTIDNQAKNGESPLHVAAEKGSSEMVKWLVDNGADVNLLNKSGGSPVILAKTVETIRLLVEFGADLNRVSFKNGSVLHTLCAALVSSSEQPYDDVLDAIIEAGIPLSATASSLQKKTAMHVAAQHGQIAILKRLIEAGADINAHTSTGYTSLHFAARKNKESCVEALLEAGAVTHIKTDRGALAKDLAGAKVQKVFERVEKEREKAKEEKKNAAEKAAKKKGKKKEPKRKADDEKRPAKRKRT